MLRRTGYILGLLFVLACVAAYPLTWRIYVGFDFDGPWGQAGFGASTGSCFMHRYRDAWAREFRVRPSVDTVRMPVRHGWLWQVAADRITFPGGDAVVYRCPLWMPALPVSLFMAWRWRRRRTRRGAGFPVAEVPSHM
jgi:hypothetical protein